MKKYTEFELALIKAKYAIMQDKRVTFFSNLMNQLNTVESTDIPTAATNGLTILYNPDFFLGLNKEERKFLILHEVMHVALLHLDRINNRDPFRWNVAGDYVINDWLKQQGYTMPEMGLHNPKYRGLSTEEVYKLLEDNKDDMPDYSEGLADLKPDAKNSEKINSNVKKALVRAKQLTEMESKEGIGELPGDLERFFDELAKPAIKWNVLLQRYLNEINKANYSWSRPNRRHFPTYYLPSLYSKGLSCIDIAIDTSGSISTTQFTGFISEVAHILRSFMPNKLRVVQFDHQIQSVNEVRNMNNLLTTKFTGGGGTNIYPVLHLANKTESRVLIVLTDGYFHLDEVPLNKDLIWCVYNNPNFKPSKGLVVHFNLEDLKNAN